MTAAAGNVWLALAVTKYRSDTAVWECWTPPLTMKTTREVIKKCIFLTCWL